MSLYGTSITCVTLTYDETNTISTHFRTICWETAVVHFLAEPVFSQSARPCWLVDNVQILVYSVHLHQIGHWRNQATHASIMSGNFMEYIVACARWRTIVRLRDTLVQNTFIVVGRLGLFLWSGAVDRDGQRRASLTCVAACGRC